MTQSQKLVKLRARKQKKVENMDLKVNRVYSAKKQRQVKGADGGFFINDRQILSIGMFDVTYDAPNAKRGCNYPRVKKEVFLNWLKEDVTDLMPKDTWREV